MTRRSLSASEAIDEVDSPVDGLEDGSLSIPSQTTGNVTGILNAFQHTHRHTHTNIFPLKIV